MLRIEIVKRADGGGVLRCTRADGSVTWQKQGRHAPFFALHDLTHFAVESTLGHRQGFFGLIAAGWDIEDTQGKGSRGPLPKEAIAVEHIVGWLDAERASGTWMGAPDGLTEEQVQRIRARRTELFQEWANVPPDGVLQLAFET